MPRITQRIQTQLGYEVRSPNNYQTRRPRQTFRYLIPATQGTTNTGDEAKTRHSDIISALTDQDKIRRAEKEQQTLTSSQLTMRLESINKKIANPPWTNTLLVKYEALKTSLTNTDNILTNDRLNRTKTDSALITLNTKVDTMFTPLLD